MKKRAVLTALLVTATTTLYSCGGGGGGSSDGNSLTPSNITTQSEAKEAVKGVSSIQNMLSLGEGNIQTMSADAKAGFLKSVLNTISRQNITTQDNETGSCDYGGTYEVKQTGNASGYVQFNNCKTSSCEILNGRLDVSMTDINNNGIPENASIIFRKGFSYENSCDNEQINIGGDFSISILGKLPGGDIYDNNQNIKAELEFDGGEVFLSQDNENVSMNFYGLTFYANEYDPQDADYEYSINGGLKYTDNFCLNKTINIIYETLNPFKEYSTSECPYTGKLLINDGQVTVIAYDNDNNPYNSNNIRITFGDNDVIFDDSCENLDSLGVCPE
ncbi:MAG: hypothetical protein D6831_02790 [Aquificota bacterium]|nr:MAG: hypothetical protein D6831_02790 [Aquificota bacterium]